MQRKYVNMLKSYEQYKPGQKKKSEVKLVDFYHQDEECNLSDEENAGGKDRLQVEEDGH